MAANAFATGGCGDTQDPRDPAESDSKSCHATQWTTITKTLHWDIYWLDSNIPRTVHITDTGQTGPLFWGCTECWPEFDTPYWSDDGRTAYWYQKTFHANFYSDIGCATASTMTSDHRQGHRCTWPSSEEECSFAEMFWNSTTNTCDETENPCSYGQTWSAEANQCCPYPPPEYQCDAIIPETNCPYNFVQGCAPSPVLVDVMGNGFQMTSAANGVDFDIDGNSDHVKERLSWTQASTDDAGLVLDRNGNGVIDSGREMFGNYTAQSQPSGSPRNGFLSLAEYDSAAKGGNGDGVINTDDAIFQNLRLWQDSNHNGISEAGELHKLKDVDLKSIDLDYKESKKTDQYGNQFRYRSKVKDTHDAQLGRWAWDVFLVRN